MNMLAHICIYILSVITSLALALIVNGGSLEQLKEAFRFITTEFTLHGLHVINYFAGIAL